MAVEAMERGAEKSGIDCRFCSGQICSEDGYYQLQTLTGEFLGNVGTFELDGELAALRESGYRLARITGGEVDGFVCKKS